MKVKPIIATGIIGLVTTGVSVAEDNKWPTSVTMSGVVQVEGHYFNDYDEVNSSDIVVDEVGLAIEAQVHKWAKGMLAFLYEEGSTPLEIDEAIITLGNSEVSPISFAIGQMYVPFGNFETQMISDPLTLELGETREKAVQVGFESGGFHGSVYGFNGSTQKNDEDTIDHYGANLGFARESDSFSYDLGGSYISDIGDTGGLTDALGGDDVSNLEGYDYVDGLSAYLILNMGSLSLIGEYVTALDNFSAEHLAFKGEGAEPKAWNLEVGYTFNMSGKEMTFALGYQGTDEAIAMELPETRYTSSLSLGIYDNTTLSFEYALEEDYDEADGGTGEDAIRATMQLAVEF